MIKYSVKVSRADFIDYELVLDVAFGKFNVYLNYTIPSHDYYIVLVRNRALVTKFLLVNNNRFEFKEMVC